MSVLSFTQYAACALVLTSTAVLFLSWVCLFVWKTAHLVVVGVRSNQDSFSIDSDGVLCPCVFKRITPAEFTVGSTATSVTFFFFGALLTCICDILYLTLCYNDDCSTVETVAALQMVSLGTAYLNMFVTHFERLRLTFSDTAMELPQWAPNVLYAILSVFCLLTTVFITFRYENAFISAICLVPLVLLYVGCVIGLIKSFFEKTMAIAHSADIEIMEAAIRVTICVSLSLLSSTLVFLWWVVALLICPNCLFWKLLTTAMFAFDICLSAFCLMCTFRRAQVHYLRVFGRLHTTFLARVLPSPNVTRNVRTVITLHTLHMSSSNDGLVASPTT